LGWETELGFHDHIPLESAIYNIEDVQLHIKGPLILATITDHPDAGRAEDCWPPRGRGRSQLDLLLEPNSPTGARLA
jgi:hypothetical protein